MANFYISPQVIEKLKEKHNVTREEVFECFCNRDGGFLEDTREEHKTNPKTQWFIAETNFGKKLKIVFIQFPDNSVRIKSAYPPNQVELYIYTQKAY